MPFFWIKLQLGNKELRDKVSTDGCEDVADFRVAIKTTFKNQLAAYEANELALFQPGGITEINPANPVSELKEVTWKPMVVTVEELPIPASISSSRKQLTYKGLGVEASCRKYFDALSRKLALFYRFKWGQDDDNDYPTFGDVLFAYKKNAWNFIYRQRSYAERTDESGFTQVTEQVPILSVRLPDLFDAEEWVKLKEWNQKTNSRIHDADLPKTSTGKYFVIIPHADYIIPETIDFFKRIGVKGQLYDNVSKLEVKDEDDLSGSSSSESGSPNQEKKL
jgi:hypothetical protein